MAVQEVFGGSLAWVADPAPGPSKLLAYRHPDVPNLGDITRVDWSAVEPVDIITGGSPCQDLSTAGRRAGMTDGTRSNLWVQMREAINVIRPRYVVWENVRGALSAVAASAVESEPRLLGDGPCGPALRAIGRVVGDLADCGYVGGWVGLRVADLGGCHGRFRVFLVARAADAERQQQREPTVGRLRDEPRRSAGDRQPLTLLRTPTAQLAINGGSQHPDKRKAGGHGPTLADEVEHLLPTPAACNPNDGESPETWLARRERVKLTASNGNGMGMPLSITVQLLTEGRDHGDIGQDLPEQDLPSLRGDLQPSSLRQEAGSGEAVPDATDLLSGVREHEGDGDQGRAALASPETQGRGLLGVQDDRTAPCPSRGPQPGEQRPGESSDPMRFLSPQASLAGGPGPQDGDEPICGCQAWGQFAPAVHSHERLAGRSAPPPTEPGPRGKPRLSPRAVEFMMCLPEGWVTDVPSLSRSEQLALLGNGACPPQAAAALRHLLERAA